MADGSDGTGKRFEDAFESPYTRRVMEWESVPPEILKRLIVAVTSCAGAVSFGQTQDGGALTLYFMHDRIPRDKRTQYLTSPDDLSDGVLRWAEYWEGYVDELNAPRPATTGKKGR